MSKNKKKQNPMRLFLLILLILLMLVSFSITFMPITHAQEPEPKITTAEDGASYAADEVLVKFDRGVSMSVADNTLEAMSSESVDTVGSLIVADVPEGETVDSFLESLEAQPNVAYAQPNYVYSLKRTVTDPFAIPAEQWHLDKIKAYGAWDLTMGSSNVRVAVIDTGVDLDHPDLTGQIVAQADFVDNDGNAQDDDGHGTHVAGIIAAKADNNEGGAGIAPNAKLIVADVFDAAGDAYTDDVVSAIQFAVTNNADVINLSLGHYESGDTALENAINAATNAGVVCVAAAGNDNTANTHYPSDFDNCISVIATDWNDERASYSNYGSAKDISAPGGDDDVPADYPASMILSTIIDGYAYMDGTSMASPVVAGVVALMRSANPYLTVNEVKDILYSTAVDLDPSTAGRDDQFGYGLVDAQAAVAAAYAMYTPTTGVSLSRSSATLTSGEVLDLNETIAPANATNKAVTYTSDNASVASVDASGRVTAGDVGTAKITVTTQEGGYTAVCTITVKSPHITTSVYAPDTTNGYIRGITPGTTVAQLKANLLNPPEDIVVLDAVGLPFTGSYVGTGMAVQNVVEGIVRESLLTVVRGDTSGDSAISISDYTLVRLHILSLKGLSGVYSLAADADQNGVISISDYTLIRLHILGLKPMY